VNVEHLTQDDLVLYRYQESPDAVAVERHLAACRQCRDEYAALERVFGLVETGFGTSHVPEPDASYERQVWTNVERRIAADAAARANRKWWMFWRAEGSVFGLGGYGLVPQLALAATIALLLVGGFAIDRAVRPSAPGAGAVIRSGSGSGAVASRAGGASAASDSKGNARGRVLYAAVGEHLQRSELMLVEFNNVEAGGRQIDLSPQQEWAEDLVSENRLYRQSAVDAGEAQMVSVLEDLERVLLEVAHAPERADGEQLNRLRTRLDTQDLLFKVRVAGAGLRAREEMAVVLDSPFGHTGSGL
jgi:hypothetical protein